MLRRTIFVLLMCLCLCMCSSALALPGTVLIKNGTAVGIWEAYEITELKIPAAVRYFSEEFVNTLSFYDRLAYIFFEADEYENLPVYDNSSAKIDLTGLKSLDSVLFHFEPVAENLNGIQEKISVGNDVDFYQFVDIDSNYFDIKEPVYKNDTVCIEWNDLGPNVWYIVTSADEGATNTYDSRSDFSCFRRENGSCTFTEVITPSDEDRVVSYKVEAHAPFCSGIERDDVRVVIPAVTSAAPSDLPSSSSSHPATGDETPIVMLAVLMAASAGVCVFSALRMKKK